MSVDLHIHSTASDGVVAPAALVALAVEAGVRGMALCDHDSVSGIEEVLGAGRERGLTVIPGVELSAETSGLSVHVLGFFIDHENEPLLEYLAHLRDIRLERARSIVRALAGGGYSVTLDDVLRFSAGGSVGRVHVAMALVEAGHVPSMGAAFSRLLGRGRPYYVSKPVSEPEVAIEAIRNAGGLAVLAHPAVSGSAHLVARLKSAGLEGIEAYHAQHSESEQAAFVRLAEKHALIVTGGSDFHAPGEGRTNLGDGGLPEAALEALLAAAGPRAARAVVAR